MFGYNTTVFVSIYIFRKNYHIDRTLNIININSAVAKVQ